MRVYVLGLEEIDKTNVKVVGGKGANLGELSRFAGIRVPDGFCVTTQAFTRIMDETPALHPLLDQLARLEVEDRASIDALSAALRRAIEANAIPADIEKEITRILAILGENSAYAVRSSATAEDLPTASFAGQQDTYLNVTGREAILQQIRKCWASLFTARAVTYRIQNGFDHRNVYLAVVVQKMVLPQVAGIMFTADPVTSNRKVVSIDASFGLGEAVVSGLVNADTYRVRDGALVDKTIATKKLAIYAREAGGTQVQEVEPAQQNRQALTDDQVLRLAQIGRQIEAHFGCPQDIEWCLVDDTFYVVQSRPITTLYPIPDAHDGVDNAPANQELRVYVSVGHQQMMTDPNKPLGLSFFLLTTRAPMRVAGGRLFVDVTPMLASPARRQALIDTLGQSEPLIKDALTTIVERGDFGDAPADDADVPSHIGSHKGMSAADIQAQTGDDPAIVTELMARSQASIDALQQKIRTKTGTDLFDFLLEDIQELQRILGDPQSMGVIFGAMHAAAWINEHMQEWLGEKNAADTLAQSVPNNVTAEMGLALLDVADVVRQYPQVIEYLRAVQDDREQDHRFLEKLVALEGGQETQAALNAYLAKYGMRCVGEIDITRPRWCETPATLIPVLLSHIKNFAPDAGKRKFEQGRQAALEKEQALLARLKQLPDGERKARETKQMIDLIRNFSGYREYPKYAMIQRYFVYRQALLREAEQLVRANVLRHKEDIYYLTFEELREVVRTHQVDYGIIKQRQDAYKQYEKLTPPRVMTSEGEVVTGAYNRTHLPADALAGLAVSAGVVEARARVILAIEDVDLADGDILVTTFTDPSWTPLFVGIKGLVTEVGGLMTHGAVIAREYGLPAVVGVENATKVIKDGQRIRVHGTEGYVEIL